MKTPTIAIVLCSLLTASLMAVEPSIVALPSPPATVGTFSGTVPLCALTSKWLVASGAFTDPVTQTVKRACFVYDTATLRFIRRIALTGLTSSLAAEGDLLVVGDTSDSGNRGAAFVFNLLNGALVKKLTDPSGLVGDVLGTQVAISGKRVLASAPEHDGLGAGAGAVYLFDLAISGAPVKFLANDGQAGDTFGNALAVSGNLAVIGALKDDDRGNDAGAVYVFDLGIEGRSIPAPTQLAKLRASDGGANNFFGRSVAISGNIIAISSADDRVGVIRPPPAIYLFNASTFAQLRRIGGDLSANLIGSTLALDDGLALVGQAEGVVFLLDANSGQIVRTFNKLEGVFSDFGFDVKLVGDTGLISDGDSEITVLKGLTRNLPVSTLTKIGDTMFRTSGRTLKTVEAYQIMDVLGGSPRVLLQGQLNGLAGRTGLWGGRTLFLAAITLENPLGGAITSRITQPVCRDPNSMMYLAQHTGPGFTTLNDTSVVVQPFEGGFGSPGTANSLYSEGQPVSLTTMNGRRISGFGQLVASGGLAFTTTIRSLGGAGSTVVTTANDSGAFVSSAVSDVPLSALLEGEASPISGINFGQVAPRIGMSSTTTAIVSTGLTGATATNAALFRLPSTLLVQKGQVAPGATPSTATFSAFLGESTHGNLLFRASLAGAPVAQNEGLWTLVGSVQSLVLQKGVEVLGVGSGLRVSRILRYASVGSNALIHATLVGTGVNANNDGVLLLATPSPLPTGGFLLRSLMREGDVAPDTGGQKFGVIVQIDTDNLSQRSSVITTLVGAPANANLALWTVRPFADGTAVRQRLRKANFSGTAGSSSLLASMKMLIPAEATGAATKGLGSPIAGDRTALILTFSDRQVLAGPIKDLEAEPEPAP